MTKTFHVEARCVRMFTSWIAIEAETPNEALAKARLAESELIATAEGSEGWLWDEFAVCDRSGKTLLHVRNDHARLCEPAPALLDVVDCLRATLKLRHVDEASDDQVAEALAMADKAMAIAITRRQWERNRKRSRRVDRVIGAYGDEVGRVNLIDLLTDLMHWCDYEFEDFQDCCERAARHFDHETMDRTITKRGRP